MMPLVIYVNTLPVYYKSGGIKTFLMELLLSFAERKSQNIRYHLLCTKRNVELFERFDAHPNFKKTVLKVDNLNPVKRIFFEQFQLNRLFKKNEKAILLNICNVALMKCAIPQVTIIQSQLSIAALRKIVPKNYRAINTFRKVYYDLLIDRSINISAKTICISNYMQQFLEAKKDKTVIIHEGVNLLQYQTNTKENCLLPKAPYIFSLSTLFPHKNMDKLIMAYSLLKKEKNIEHKLVIAGKDPDNKQLKYLQQVAKEQDVENDVIFLGWVAVEDIPSLYRNASLFVYISGMEFFGLPVLEAMASNVPVIAANKMSIPEVVNDAGILVEPDDIRQVSEKMHDVLSSDTLQISLIKKGQHNIQVFKWDVTAEKFEKVFLEIAEKFSTN